MKPILELEREHNDMVIILDALNRKASKLSDNKHIDLSLVRRMMEFLRNYVDQCHFVKEEKILFPALNKRGSTSVKETINELVRDHMVVRYFLNEIDFNLQLYLPRDKKTAEKLSLSMNNYVFYSLNHIDREIREIFPKVDTILDDEAQQAISTRFSEVQHDRIGHRKAQEFYKLLNEIHHIKSENKSKSSFPWNNPVNNFGQSANAYY